MSNPTSSHDCQPDTYAPVTVMHWACPCGAQYDLVVEMATVELWGRPTKLANQVWQRRAVMFL